MDVTIDKIPTLERVSTPENGDGDLPMPVKEPREPLDKKKYSKTTSIAVHTLLFGISSIFERCLATLLGLQTMEHGTDILSYLSICATGADPSRGGTGSAVSPAVPREEKERFIKNCKGKFHVVQDVELRKHLHGVWIVFSSAIKTFAGRFFSAFAGTSKFKKLPIVCHLIGFVHFFTCPLLRFHYTKEEGEKVFVEDTDTKPVGATTEQALPTHRIGMWGVLKHGSFKGIGSRFYNRPMMMTACVVGVIAGAALTAVGLGFVT